MRSFHCWWPTKSFLDDFWIVVRCCCRYSMIFIVFFWVEDHSCWRLSFENPVGSWWTNQRVNTSTHKRKNSWGVCPICDVLSWSFHDSMRNVWRLGFRICRMNLAWPSKSRSSLRILLRCQQSHSGSCWNYTFILVHRIRENTHKNMLVLTAFSVNCHTFHIFVQF